MNTINDVIDDCEVTAGLDEAAKNTVIAALQEREDQIRDNLNVIAAQLGTYPEFVAEAFAEVGLGTPPTPEVREMLRTQFATRMAWLQEQYRQQQEGGA
jgi:hypothetical protein